mmetsp:Transcript_5238/g.5128  ORF Transcript_5238/g.5128 Transcript_5238/m.5128 type:complete len:80 (+) Transcript_5238:123-362(+)
MYHIPPPEDFHIRCVAGVVGSPSSGVRDGVGGSSSRVVGRMLKCFGNENSYAFSGGVGELSVCAVGIGFGGDAGVSRVG